VSLPRACWWPSRNLPQNCFVQDCGCNLSVWSTAWHRLLQKLRVESGHNHMTLKTSSVAVCGRVLRFTFETLCRRLATLLYYGPEKVVLFALKLGSGDLSTWLYRRPLMSSINEDWQHISNRSIQIPQTLRQIRDPRRNTTRDSNPGPQLPSTSYSSRPQRLHRGRPRTHTQSFQHCGIAVKLRATSFRSRLGLWLLGSRSCLEPEASIDGLRRPDRCRARKFPRNAQTWGYP